MDQLAVIQEAEKTEELDQHEAPEAEGHEGASAGHEAEVEQAEKSAESPLPEAASGAELMQGSLGGAKVGPEKATKAPPDPGLAAPGKGHGGKGKKGKKGKGKKPVPKPKLKAVEWTEKSIRHLVSKHTAADVIDTIAGPTSRKEDIKTAVDLLVALGLWEHVSGSLPHGARMKASARTALIRILDADAVSAAEAQRLFQIRFKHEMKDDTGSWSLANIKIVWKQLDVLPEADVSKNTVMKAFTSITGGGGLGPSWEDTANINTVQLGEDATPESLPHTVRHEVGHGVHAEIPGQINAWLQGDMQFWFGSGDRPSVQTWIEDLGGFPATYNDGGAKAFDDTAKAWVTYLVESWMGSGGWGPSRPGVTDGQTPAVSAMWDAMGPKVKNAVAQSTTDWYKNWNNFQKGAGGKRYFLNHYYHRPFTMGAKCDEVVTATGDPYTSMSEKEFFANAYAEYFADPKGYSDHKKWGGKLPGSVKDFFNQCIVERQPYQNFKKAQDKKAATGGAKH